MNDPTEHEIDDDIEQSMAMFERSKVGPVARLQALRPKRILLALDGSTGDQQVLTVANRLRENTGGELVLIDVAEQSPPGVSPYAAQSGEEVTAEILPTGEGCNYEQILTAVNQSGADLLVLTCPFGRDFESIGTDSTGTVIDVMLARLNVPMVVVRAPFDADSQVFDRIKILLTGDNEAATDAARWSMGLARSGGQLTLSLQVKQEFFEQVRATIAAIHPETHVDIESLENVLAQKYSRLHAQLQHATNDMDLNYRMRVHHESDETGFAIPESTAHPMLLVLPLADRSETGPIADTIRHASHPILVVSHELPSGE